jgi:hypothetical protein
MSAQLYQRENAIMLLALLLGMFIGPASAVTTTCQGVTITPGSNDRVLCSKKFLGSGICTGQATLATLVDDKSFPNGHYVTPWEPSSISIVGVELFDVGGTVNQYMVAGNSFTPDVMVWHDVGHRRTVNWFPAGTSMQFPPSTLNPPHLDLHVACTGGGQYQVYYTIYYTVP